MKKLIKAKNALKLNTLCRRKNTINDIRANIRLHVKKLWREKWRNIHNNKLREILENSTNNFQTYDKTRRDNIKIRRLRIGHSNLTHNYFVKKDNPPMCNCDNTITIKHIFNDCTIYNISF